MRGNESPAVSARHISKSYGKKQVLFDVDLAIPYGKIVGIIGPSGCGKTTLVKIIAGILQKDSGKVKVLDFAVPSLEAMKDIGYMAQRAALYSILTGRENLEFFGKMYGLKKEELQARIAYVADLVDLTEELDKKVINYSGGMLQRLSLAVALVAEPKVLILDEPTVGIDPVLRKEIWKELYQLAEAGIAILVTTHVMDKAEKCDLLAMMREGRVIATGHAKQLMAHAGAKTIEEAFIRFGERSV